MERELLDEVVHTDFGQFDLVWGQGGGFDGTWDRFFRGQENGLVGAADPSGVYLNLARRSGGSRVRLVLVGVEPPLLPAHYEDVVEVSVSVPAEAEVHWMSWAGETGGRVAVAPGSYRLRVSAHGRDAGRNGEFADDVVDEYVLQLWPANAGPDKVARAGSDDAGYWHREIGSRR